MSSKGSNPLGHFLGGKDIVLFPQINANIWNANQIYCSQRNYSCIVYLKALRLPSNNPLGFLLGYMIIGAFVVSKRYATMGPLWVLIVTFVLMISGWLRVFNKRFATILAVSKICAHLRYVVVFFCRASLTGQPRVREGLGNVKTRRARDLGYKWRVPFRFWACIPQDQLLDSVPSHPLLLAICFYTS